MAKSKANNTLIGRKVRVNFACRWEPIDERFRAAEKAKYAQRPDWNKAGEIVFYNPEEKLVTVLFDEEGHLEDYYMGEVTVIGPAANPEQEVVDLLTQIRDLLRLIRCK